jgi:hypothetical protein
LPFDVSYELDFWGRVRRTVASAREFAQASAADVETAKLSLQAELAFDYFELRSADAQTQILDNTVESYGEALRLTQNRYQGAGTFRIYPNCEFLGGPAIITQRPRRLSRDWRLFRKEGATLPHQGSREDV